MMISSETARDIAYAWREIETAEKLLAEISEELDRVQRIDIRDGFSRRQNGLQLGVPSGNNSHRLFNVPFSIARPIIEMHIAQQKTLIEVLSARAISESAEGGKPDRASGDVARPAGGQPPAGGETAREAK